MANAVNIFCDHLGNIGNHLRQQNCIRVHGGVVHGRLQCLLGLDPLLLGAKAIGGLCFLSGNTWDL